MRPFYSRGVEHPKFDKSVVINNNDNLVVKLDRRVDRDTVYEITWLIRRLFRAMSTRADDYLKESGLAAADRAVMEFLYPDKQLSVPEIARRYRVSRQHVQVTANNLMQRGLVHSKQNPRHKRSSLLSLSELGRDTFTEIRHDEDALLNKLFAGFRDNDLNTTRSTLRSLYENLT